MTQQGEVQNRTFTSIEEIERAYFPALVRGEPLSPGDPVRIGARLARESLARVLQPITREK